MRVQILTCCWLMLLSEFAMSQDNRGSDANDKIIEEVAMSMKDFRSAEQIKIDNKMILAAAKGDLEDVRTRLKNGALINSRYIDTDAFLDAGFTGFTALMFAIRNKRTDVIKLLIENGPDLEVTHLNGATALYMAVVRNETVAIDLLVKAGAKQDPAKIRLARELIDAACKGFVPGSYEPFPPYPGARA